MHEGLRKGTPMDYCARCLYPTNARPTIILDEQGICSGCRHHDARHSINWPERATMLKNLLEDYKAQARSKRNVYDCIVPVSGGKDSHYLVHLVKVVHGL